MSRKWQRVVAVFAVLALAGTTVGAAGCGTSGNDVKSAVNNAVNKGKELAKKAGSEAKKAGQKAVGEAKKAAGSVKKAANSAANKAKSAFK